MNTQNKKYITCDGNYAASHVAYMFTEIAAIYPITPSSNMAENVDEWSSNGRKNIFGETVKVVEMQSEGGAAGSVHGSLLSGALTTTFTASQGLLLMIPNMYKIAGELLPGVFHVSARTIAGHALSIFGDHSDVYSTRQTGFAMLADGSVQETMDLAAVAHLSAIKTRIPFLNFFDGFRTSHELQKVEALQTEDMAKIVDYNAIEAFRNRALNPDNPVTRGTAMNSDIFFQSKEALNPFYTNVADVVDEYMNEIMKLTGREYHPFTYYGHPEAENIVVAMGSVTETIKETIDYLMGKGEKVGLISVHLYRPFSAKYFFKALPDSVQRIAVLDRTKEPGAGGDPLYLDVVEIFNEVKDKPMIIAGRYGLASKDTTPAQIVAIYENLKQNTPKHKFTVGIVDDVTYTSIPVGDEISLSANGQFEGKFYGLGSDGTVTANKNSIKIIAQNTDKYCQAYFSYDSKKSGGVTVSHLRFGDKPIRSTYLVNTPDFVACHVPSYLDKYDMLKGLKQGGTFLLNSIWNIQETIEHLPDSMKKYMAENNISFYIINATKIAEEIGLGNRTNTIMQSAFFKISGVIPYDVAVKDMREAVVKSFGRKGEKVISMNHKAIDRGAEVVKIEILKEWKNIELKSQIKTNNIPEFIDKVCNPVFSLKGDDLPVSTFTGSEDGTFPNGTTAYEKRGIAIEIPEWNAENCIQCNKCSFACPHAVIRPFLLNYEEMEKAPEGTVTIDAIGKSFKDHQYRMQISPLDCTGCGNCVDVCPGRKKDGIVHKALKMVPLESQKAEIERWEYFDKNVTYKDKLANKYQSVKNSQFAQPLFEFSGACAGCGETPYIKLITQLYGDRMMNANGTGCSCIYGGTAPSSPYCTNPEGKGPTYANSLFEDNAEFGYGMALAVTQKRERVARLIQSALNEDIDSALKDLFKTWLDNYDNIEISEQTSKEMIPLLAAENNPICKDIYELRKYLIKKSIWMIGGDGWAYDIGFGGLDHVIASGEDVNILVMDTEVYSNTGGQSSKATPAGAVAKFATSGKKVKKKDLGLMAMSYGYVYVAQVAMGANNAQYLKALREAEAYNGPSLIIAYSPCINHGLVKGMGKSQAQMADAVEAGYWHCYRYNPMLEQEGKNPFILDSKEPNWSRFREFLNSEVRYTSLIRTFPDEAEKLFKEAEENARWRYQNYKRLEKMNYTVESL